MKHIRQPRRSVLCAHACVAMILGLELDAGVKLLGHRRVTRTKELVQLIGKHAKDKRLISVRQRPAPAKALLRVTWGKSHRGHFAIKRGTTIYDPLRWGPLPQDEWEEWISEHSGRVTSALELRLT